MHKKKNLQMSQLSAFMNLLTQFLDELVTTFPELSDLRTIQTLVSMLKPINPRFVLENFIEVAGRYHEKIFYEQSSFFEDLENWKKDPYFQSEFAEMEDVFQKLVVFKVIWTDLSDSNKENIWTYLQQLLVISAKASKNNPDLCKKIIDCAIIARNRKGLLVDERR